MSTVVGTTSNKTLDVDDDSSNGKRKSLRDDIEKKEIKFTFKPISTIEFGDTDGVKSLRAELENLEPINKGDMTMEINMRSMISMDNEPTYFLQAFQGSMIIRTNDYLSRETLFIANEMDEESYVMLFQLIGQPNLN